MSDKDEVRQKVSEFYARSVNEGSDCGCCCGGGDATLPKGVAAKHAGYQLDALKQLPEDAVRSSFGCGDPLAFSQVEPGQTVLDLGSGAGLDLLIAAEKVGPTGKVIGVDMTDDMLERARANVKAAGLTNVELRKGIIEQLPVESGTIDWVISNCVINLSPEKERVFAEIARVLKPGGRISISDIVAQDLPPWVLESAALYASCIAGAISEQAYLDGLRQAGLEQVEVTERLVYDEPQLKGLVASEVPAEQSACCGGIPAELLDMAAGTVAGKIWSAKVTGRKA